ncbi:MAG: protein kinase [Verrucomicrobia bacterium]|nr:protein kinase [Verrucomicrobiota bacterium]
MGHCPACLFAIGLKIKGEDPFHRDIPASESPASGAEQSLGDYVLIAEIARGGMGVVYRAWQPRLKRMVALKLLRAGELADSVEVARFQSEAEAVAELDHPHIVPILDVGEESGRHYFTMKLIEGDSLAQRLGVSGGRRLDVRESVLLLRSVAAAVHYAHQRGILHRDLKPGNILIDASGCPYVTDFGLAKRIECDMGATLPGVVLGTPNYIAPEQASGQKGLTTSADIYSLGAILYEMLTGHPPFEGETLWDTLCKVRESRPPLIRAQNPLVDSHLETVCLKCLQKEPRNRYRTAEELADDLGRWLRDEPVSARAAPLSEQLRMWSRREPLAAGLSVLAVVLLLLGVAGVSWQWRKAVSAREAALKATREKELQLEQLWKAQSMNARHHRTSRVLGQRTNAWAVISAAAAIKPSLELSDEAIATLLLTDLGPRVWWKDAPSFEHPACYDPGLDHYVLHSESGVVTVRRSSDHAPVQELGRGRRQTTCVRFSADGLLLGALFEDGELRVWNWKNAELLAEIEDVHVRWGAQSFDFADDSESLLFVQTPGTTVSRLRWFHGVSVVPALTNAGVESVAAGPSGSQVACALGGSLELWEGDPLRRTAVFHSGRAGARYLRIAWHPAGQCLAVAGENAVDWVDLGKRSLRPLPDMPDLFVGNLFFGRGGELLFAGGWHDLFLLWDVASQECLLQSQRHIGSPVAVSAGGDRIAFSRERVGFGVWELLAPTGLHKLIAGSQPSPPFASMDLHPNGTCLAMSDASGWSLWDPEAPRPFFSRKTDAPQIVKFSRDGLSLYTAGSDGLLDWPLEPGSEARRMGVARVRIRRLPNLTPGMPEVPIQFGLFAADGRNAVLVGGGQALAWDLTEHRALTAVALHRPEDSTLGLSPDPSVKSPGPSPRKDGLYAVWRPTIARLGLMIPRGPFDCWTSRRDASSPRSNSRSRSPGGGWRLMGQPRESSSVYAGAWASWSSPGFAQLSSRRD